MGRCVVAVLLALTASCTKRNPAACCTTDADCDQQGLPPGTDCGASEVCIRNSCEPKVACQSASDCDAPTPLCDAASEVCVECLSADDCDEGICDPQTFVCRGCAADADCASGYCALSTGECGENVVEWKYLPSACTTTAAASWTVTTNSAIDTSDQAQCNGGVVPQTDGPDICVMRYSTVTIAASASIQFTGSRAVGLVADGDIQIAGTIDLAANSTTGASGPGGGTRVSGSVPVSPSTAATDGAGGGGAGFQTAGGNGGGPVTNGGAAFDAIASTILLGGYRAESPPAVFPINNSRGAGGGGGAMVVLSCDGKIVVNGAINASGAGGGGGTASGTLGLPMMTWNAGGFGGGAGGNVLFEAVEIELTGTFVANGGGGGAGRPSNQCSNCVGEAGGTPTLSVPCPAPAMPTGGAGAGGNAGCGSNTPTAGSAKAQFAAVGETSGGGGGSVGYFRTATPTGTAVVTPTVAQPPFSAHETVPRH